MTPEHKLLLAISDILRTSYPHLDDLHKAVLDQFTPKTPEAPQSAAGGRR
jgi:hypothetical protein